MSNKRLEKTGQFNLRYQLELAEKRGLPAKEKNCVIVFIDIVGYSKFASRSTDKEVLELVRRFENVCRKLISEYGGRVVMTAGDAIMACWDDKEDLSRATNCAQRIKKKLDEGNKQRPGKERIRIRAGLHCGLVMLLQDGDVIGNAVNLASRLQTAAKPGEVLISSEAAEMGAGVADMPVCNKIGHMRLKGFSQAVEVACVEDAPKKIWIKHFSDAISSPFKLSNWQWDSWTFIIIGLLLSAGMMFATSSEEFPDPEFTAFALFFLFFGWAFLWALYRPRIISVYHFLMRMLLFAVWGVFVVLLGGHFDCWPG